MTAEKRRAILIVTTDLDDNDSMRQEINADKYNDDVPAALNDLTYALGSFMLRHLSREAALEAIETTIPNQLRDVIESSETM